MIDRYEIVRLTAQHAAIVSIAVGLGVVVGVPLGVVMTRRKGLVPFVQACTTALQTMPSMALLGLLLLAPGVGGLGARPAITALFLYSLLAIVENTYVGIRQVDPAIVVAGRGLGMTDAQILRWIELPQALPVIVAGVRIATVASIGTATIASYIGAGGLGDLIFRGVSRGDPAAVAWGAVPAIAMSLAAYLLLGAAERRLGRRAKPR